MAFSAEYIYRIRDKYSGPLQRITRQTKKFKLAAASTAIALSGMNKKLRTMGRASRDIGGQLTTRMTLPIAALGTAGVISFARIEKGLINVNNLLERDELLKYRGKLDSLHDGALKAGFVIDDVNKGLFDTVSALGANDAAFKAFNAAQKLAIGGATSLGVSVDGLSSILSVYKDQNVSAMEAANAFFSSQVKGKTTVELLASNIGTVAPIAKAAGVGFKELLATLSALTLGGLSTDLAATSLKGAITALVKPQHQAAKVMKKMGIEYGAATIKSKGLKSVLLSLARAQEKYGLDAVAMAIPNVRALTAVTAMSEIQLAKVDEIMQKINSDMKTGDGLMRAYSDQNDSMSRKFEKAKGRMTVAFKKFVILFAPQINKMIDSFGRLMDKFSALSPKIKTIIVVLAGLAAVIPPLLVGFGFLAMSISALIPAILGVTAPMVFWAALIVGVGALLVGLYTKSAMFRQSLANLADAFSPILEGLKMISFGLGDSGSDIKTWGDVFSNVINMIAGMFKGLFNIVANLGTAAGALSVGNFGDAWEALKGGGGIDMGGIGKEPAGNKAAGRAQNNKNELNGLIKVSTEQGTKLVSAEIALDTGYNLVSH